MFPTYTHQTEVVRLLLERAHGVAARIKRGPDWEFGVDVLGGAKGNLSVEFSNVILTRHENRPAARDHVDACVVIVNATGPDDAFGTVGLYLVRRMGRQYDNMFAFEYATRGDLKRLAVDHILKWVGDFLVDGEPSFIHSDAHYSNDNNRHVYLRKVSGPAMIG